MEPPSFAGIRLYSPSEWRIAAATFFGYLLVYALSATYIPSNVPFFAASGVALAGLFFGGSRLSPVVFVAALSAGLLYQATLPFAILSALTETFQSVAGGTLFRRAEVDALFRRYRDTFYLISTTIVISAIRPTIDLVLAYSPDHLPQPGWAQVYVAMLMSLLITTPFLMRWSAKMRFKRRPREVAEILFIFATLIAIDIALLVLEVPRLFDIPLSYFLLVPFFWIALRLRPRFVSLALIITAGFFIGSAVMSVDPNTLVTVLYRREAALIMLAISFFIVVSLEEDRRVHTNRMKSQLATLENAVSRVISESRAKNDFIAVLAHELRNPLAPVVSNIELLKLKGPRDEEEQHLLSVMGECMNVVRRLLDDLLDISRVTEGKVTLEFEAVNLADILLRAQISTAHLITERHQSLVMKLPKESLMIAGDPVRLEQIFSNLLTNASKYSHTGGLITANVSTKDSMAEVEIIDVGIGISADDLESIFTPFHQIEVIGSSSKGLGIGLALVNNFVGLHGGTVRAESAGIGHGSRFLVGLPLLPKTHMLRVKKTETQKATAPHTPERLSILVVDDNEAAAAGIGRLLELSGCSVSYAHTGTSAIEHTLAIQPMIVILDIGLPDQDGYNVARTLRTQGFTGRLIALTGFSTDEARDKGTTAGFDDYLVKPAGLADLRQAISELN